ncbi:MAG: T9SS C-terminal target domain-containing protein, partial [Bacteroidota bacterium]|nr:T9SS C-terminal target domain-containing protein [Bacteroidota bacterium]
MKKLLSALMILAAMAGYSQAPFGIHLEPMTISGLGGIQSYAFGQANGKWLIVGGRLDGLHRRQPWASFDIAGHNDQLIVVDPVAGTKWTQSMAGLPSPVREQLSSTNMNFHQSGGTLYVIGGYGYSTTAGDHVTYPLLTAIDVPGLIQAIIGGSAIGSYFRQISHPDFAVTGGQLEKIYDTWYLVGGQKFDGRYNPMGHSTFVQTYTNAIRRFKIQDDGIQLQVIHLPAWTSATSLHRRDYNVASQIMPNGEEGVTAYSGVFQTTADIPFLDCVNVDSSGFAVDPNFAQYYNHYHCATMPLYSE